jgi:hypothetical protein
MIPMSLRKGFSMLRYIAGISCPPVREGKGERWGQRRIRFLRLRGIPD